ncbi:DUF2127 domain-containing protein [Bdellovibrio sp. HCB209]|uniref:DUF2127 domain-containing protein n=1 Tax=Bdellovibrio sp. HCB209 TaxID=3394354 RepID=UPI0039B6239E
MANDGLRTGVQAIAGFEAAKGVAVVMVGIGAFSIMGQNVHETGVKVVRYLGLQNTEYSAFFMEAFDSLGETGLQQLVVFAFLYSTIRFVEAYGLWKEKVWAEWLAILSGAIYLPFEFLKMAESFAWWKAAITFVNIAIVAYLVFVRVKTHRVRALS